MIVNMKRNFLSYIIPLLGILVVSCQADLNGIGNNLEESDGHSISVSVDIPEVRTRAIDMTPGAAVYLKNIWIGVYDKTTGNRVGGTGGDYTDSITLGDRLVASGSTIIDLVEIGFDTSINLDNTNKYCVVGVANYHGIKIKPIEGTDSGTQEQNLSLYTALEAADTWDKFQNIAIDTQESVFELQTPMLAGYMKNESAETANNGYIKVNQFATEETEERKINLSGYGTDESAVFLKGKANGIDTKGYVLKLRRMRSKINVLINKKDENGNPIEGIDGITITNLQYQVFNKPKSAFLVQRRTNTFKDDCSGMIESKYSPNSADMIEGGYFEDDAWITPPISTEFSFEHFENKHWAVVESIVSDDLDDDDLDGELSDYEKFKRALQRNYHAREAKNENGAFTALVGENGTDENWNNNASYFILKMNIRDENTGRNGEVEYIIHEGFVNDAEGFALPTEDEDENVRLWDFACIRNTDYYYNITVMGIEDIYLQVTSTNYHTNDEQGKIWQVNHAKYKNDADKYLESETEYQFGEALILKPENDKEIANSDIAVRIVGSIFDYEKYKEYGIDVCYNFAQGDLDGFAGLWPEPTNEFTEYIVAGDKFDTPYEAFTDFCNNKNSINANYFNEFNNKLRVIYNDKPITIKEYIAIIQDAKNSPNIQGYEFDGLKYYIKFDESNDTKKAHVRGIYIFDKQKALSNSGRVAKDADGCSYLYQINAAEQIPVYLADEKYQMIYASNNVPWNQEDGTFIEFNNGYTGSDYSTTGMILTKHPDIAFRLLGFDGNTREYYDIFYNLGLNEYSSFYNNNNQNGWPARDLNGGVSKSIARGALSTETIPQSFLDGLQVVVNKNNQSDVYDLATFIRDFENRTIKLDNTCRLGFQVKTYDKKAPNNTSDRGKYVRALYLLDRKNPFNVPIFLSSDGTSATFYAYGLKQDPEFVNPTQLVLPTGLPSRYSDDTKYNVIDPSIEAFSIPAINGVLPTDYRYKIVATSNGSTLYSYVNGSPENNSYTFSVPMHYLPGTTGSLQIIAEAISEEYINSALSAQIGTYTLNTPPTWEYDETNKNDWYYAYEYLKEHGRNMYIGSDQDERIKYLRFAGGGFDAVDNGCICVYSDVGTISFRVYKPCTIKVEANGAEQNERGLQFIMDGNLKKYYDLDANSYTDSNNQPYEYKVYDTDFGGKDDVTITLRRTGGNINVKSIQVVP